MLSLAIKAYSIQWPFCGPYCTFIQTLTVVQVKEINLMHIQNAVSLHGFKKAEYSNKIFNTVLNLKTRAQLMNAATDFTSYSNDK